jgi:hypothetical protein
VYFGFLNCKDSLYSRPVSFRELLEYGRLKKEDRHTASVAIRVQALARQGFIGEQRNLARKLRKFPKRLV